MATIEPCKIFNMRKQMNKGVVSSNLAEYATLPILWQLRIFQV